MQFVKNRFVPRAAMPVVLLPFEPLRMNDFAGTVHAGRLVTRRWIGDFMAVVDSELISRARASFAGDEFEPTVVKRMHGQTLRREFNCEALRARRPKPKPDHGIVEDFGAKGHFVVMPHGAGLRLRSSARIRSGVRSTSRASERGCRG